tara:strand:+ start:493 stop:669 length:177 start_codon:yes stop_codon:yes gene_type:complete
MKEVYSISVCQIGEDDFSSVQYFDTMEEAESNIASYIVDGYFVRIDKLYTHESFKLQK